MLESIQEAVLEAVEQRHDEAVRFLAELVKAPSDNPPGDCAGHGERTARLLEGLGFVVERHPVPAAEVRARGMASLTNLIVRERFGDGPTVALNAHGDAVPPGDAWSTDPYGAEIRSGVMFGRGVAVSKSDFATYAFALLALKQLAARLDGTVELHFTYDEEAGGLLGPKWLLEQGLSKPDFAIAAGFSYGVVTAHNGCLHLEVEVQGRSAHAADPASGVDALEAASAALAALYEHRKAYAKVSSRVPGIGAPTLVVGLIEGGINTNVVPDRISFRIDRRVIPEEDVDAVEGEISKIIKRAVAGVPGAKLSVRRLLWAASFAPVAGAERLAGILAANAGRIMAEETPIHGVPLYTDARHYAAAGIPTVIYGAGPRTISEANAHRADERLRLDDLRKATKVVALSLLELLAPAS